MSDDTFKRRAVGPDEYQCGCRWERWPGYGDVLVECPIHAAAGVVQLKKFTRKQLASAADGRNRR